MAGIECTPEERRLLDLIQGIDIAHVEADDGSITLSLATQPRAVNERATTCHDLLHALYAARARKSEG